MKLVCGLMVGVGVMSGAALARTAAGDARAGKIE
jgi:hypothetical protein